MYQRTLAFLTAGAIAVALISCGVADPSVSNASVIIKKNLLSPSSFSLVSGKKVWSGKDTEGNAAYVVRVEYDAQNGFGAIIRACKLVAYSVNGDSIEWSIIEGIGDCEENPYYDETVRIGWMVTRNFETPRQQKPVVPAPTGAVPVAQEPSPTNASAKALEDQLACIKSPDPGAAIRAMVKNGMLKDTDWGADGIPVFAPTAPLTVFGKRVTFVAGWQTEPDGSVKKPFWRGRGTAPPHHVAVSIDAKPSDIAYKPREVRDADGRLVGSFASIEAGSLDYSAGGSTITCYGGHE